MRHIADNGWDESLKQVSLTKEFWVRLANSFTTDNKSKRYNAMSARKFVSNCGIQKQLTTEDLENLNKKCILEIVPSPVLAFTLTIIVNYLGKNDNETYIWPLHASQLAFTRGQVGKEGHLGSGWSTDGISKYHDMIKKFSKQKKKLESSDSDKASRGDYMDYNRLIEAAKKKRRTTKTVAKKRKKILKLLVIWICQDSIISCNI